MTSDAAIAPANWAIQYQIVSSAVRRRSRNIPSETIGLKCPPETSPKAYRPASRAIPKPNAISILSAEPPEPRIASDPMNTRMYVPSSSATYFCQLFTVLTSETLSCQRERCQVGQTDEKLSACESCWC